MNSVETKRVTNTQTNDETDPVTFVKTNNIKTETTQVIGSFTPPHAPAAIKPKLNVTQLYLNQDALDLSAAIWRKYYGNTSTID